MARTVTVSPVFGCAFAICMPSLLPWRSRRQSDVESGLEPLKSNLNILWNHFGDFVTKILQNQCLSDQESVESPIFGRNWPENAEFGLNPTEAFEKTVAAF